MKFLNVLAAVVMLFLLVSGALYADTPNNKDGEINLVVRVDDIGFCHAANIACIDAYQNGIARSVEVMPNCSWFMEAAEMLRENQGFDVGVHLTLNCEWKNYKWLPLTGAKSLVDENNYFPPSTAEFNNQDVDLNELEKELRAQIELAMKHIPQISHLSYHMGTALSKPEYTAIVEKLSKEYNLPMAPKNVAGKISFWAVPVDEKEDYLVKTLNELGPGNWLFVCHPGLDVAETKAISGVDATHDANARMSVHRQAVLRILKSEKIQNILKKRNIRVMSYADTYK